MLTTAELYNFSSASQRIVKPEEIFELLHFCLFDDTSVTTCKKSHYVYCLRLKILQSLEKF